MAEERGITMSAWSVGQILAGRKSQTRRVITKPERLDGLMLAGEEAEWCPYGMPGDLLYCREPLKETPHHFARYVADNEFVKACDTKEHWWKWKRSTLPGRFMPKWAARIWLAITDIRVERVQEISAAAAIAEGVEPGACGGNSFKTLWDSIYAKRGCGFDENPFVWVLTFERTERRRAVS